MKLFGPVAGGVLFSLLFIVGMVMMNLPVGGGSSTDEEIREFYAESGDRTRVVISMYVLAAAGVAFIFFLGGLYRRLRGAARSDDMATAALIAGIGFLAMLFAGAAALGSIAGGIQLGDEPETLGDTGVARFLGHTGYAMLLVMGALSAAAMIVATSIAILRDRGLSANWVAWVGFVLAAILLAGIIFLPMLALPIWVLLASFALLNRDNGTSQRIAA